jgi:hypothetical protein
MTEPKPPLNLESCGDIEFRQQPDGVVEILDHEKSQRSWYSFNPFERDE